MGGAGSAVGLGGRRLGVGVTRRNGSSGFGGAGSTGRAGQSARPPWLGGRGLSAWARRSSSPAVRALAGTGCCCDGARPVPRPLALSPSRPLARLSCPRRPLTLLPSPPAGLRAPAHQLDMAYKPVCAVPPSPRPGNATGRESQTGTGRALLKHCAATQTSLPTACSSWAACHAVLASIHHPPLLCFVLTGPCDPSPGQRLPGRRRRPALSRLASTMTLTEFVGQSVTRARFPAAAFQ
ncbi:hypothetical protein J3E74DRAFT_476744 [Bipolaris maydis]|nr:hypothetical protein J3E74DRAFT_476744 [Bipolaris maydis]